MAADQPMVVFVVLVDTIDIKIKWELSFLGHASPDEADGKLYTETVKLTSYLVHTGGLKKTALHFLGGRGSNLQSGLFTKKQNQ